MPCSRASNSRKPDLVVSLDYLLFSLSSLTQHVPAPRGFARLRSLSDLGHFLGEVAVGLLVAGHGALRIVGLGGRGT